MSAEIDRNNQKSRPRTRKIVQRITKLNNLALIHPLTCYMARNAEFMFHVYFHSRRFYLTYGIVKKRFVRISKAPKTI